MASTSRPRKVHLWVAVGRLACGEPIRSRRGRREWDTEREHVTCPGCLKASARPSQAEAVHYGAPRHLFTACGKLVHGRRVSTNPGVTSCEACTATPEWQQAEGAAEDAAERRMNRD
jgi:hypothetical protein